MDVTPHCDSSNACWYSNDVTTKPLGLRPVITVDRPTLSFMSASASSWSPPRTATNSNTTRKAVPCFPLDLRDVSTPVDDEEGTQLRTGTTSFQARLPMRVRSIKPLFTPKVAEEEVKCTVEDKEERNFNPRNKWTSRKLDIEYISISPSDWGGSTPYIPDIPSPDGYNRERTFASLIPPKRSKILPSGHGHEHYKGINATP